MSKELTEQWKNGTLPENWYYIHLKSNCGNIDCITINYCDEDGVFEEYPDEDIKEVLAPVPSYDEYNELVQKTHILEKQLEYAERTLKNIRILMTCDPSDMKEIDENFCANQLALETVNGYFEKYGVEK